MEHIVKCVFICVVYNCLQRILNLFPCVFFVLKIDLFLFYMHGYFASVCLCTLCVQCSQKPEEGVKSSGTGVTDGCERAGKVNPSLLQEQQMLLTAEPSVQPLRPVFNLWLSWVVLWEMAPHTQIYTGQNVGLGRRMKLSIWPHISSLHL